jgi:pyroglutamyl-peptidase
MTTDLQALVLGSEPFAGLDRNPAAEIAMAMNTHRIEGMVIKGATLPVSHRLLPERIAALMASYQPKIVVALGLFIGASTIRVESTAINRADFDVADSEGRFVRDERLDRDGPMGRTTPYPAEAIAAAIRSRGIPARSSHHAGTNLCNSVLYHLLGTAGEASIVGFLHLPLLPEQVAALMTEASTRDPHGLQPAAEHPSMGIDMQIFAVKTALIGLAEISRRGR